MYGKILRIFSLFLFFGLLASVSEASSQDLEAEAQKLTQDFQSGKIDMQTFKQGMMELQAKLLQEYATPEQKRLLEQARQQNALSPDDMARAQQEAQNQWEQAQSVEQAPERKATREPDFTLRDIAVPSQLFAILPPGTVRVEYQYAKASGAGADIRLDVDVHQERSGASFRFSISSSNPEFNDLAWLNAQRFTEKDMAEVKLAAARAGEQLRVKPWGWGYTHSSRFEAPAEKGEGVFKGVIHEGEYAGKIGDVLFRVSGSVENMEAIADKLAGLAPHALNYESLVRSPQKP